MITYPDSDPPAVAPIDACATDAAAERNQRRARLAENMHLAQDALSIQIRQHIIKNLSV